MIKSLLIAFVALALLAGVFLGPDLLDMYRLDGYIKSSAQAYEVERGPWPQLSDACTSCHGANGNSLNQSYPSLAGQTPAYLSTQLRRFASGERVSPIMNAMARSLKDSDIDPIAAFFARQSPSDNRFFKPDDTLLEKGKQIVASGGCVACHGDSLMGKGATPRLAGQSYDYLVKQLDSFADGRRRDPAQMMNALASQWSPEQRQAVATFLASRQVSGRGHPVPAAASTEKE